MKKQLSNQQKFLILKTVKMEERQIRKHFQQVKRNDQSFIGHEVNYFFPIEDTMVQMELLKKLTAHHSPYTLQMGGLFHLAFGALLTGSAFGLKK